MKYALHFPNFGVFDPRTLAILAKDAEDVGWDGIFIWDHVNRIWNVPVYDPWICLAAVAISTERVKIGTLVTPLARRRPQKVARETVSLDKLSNGRLILGVGIGSTGGAEVEWANFGEEMNLKTRATMTDEALDILTGLWSGATFSYSGEHYTVRESRFLPKPVQQPRIPIWIAGNYPAKPPMRRAARWDGMVLHYRDVPNEADAIRDSLRYVQQFRQTDAPFDVVTLNERAADVDTTEIQREVAAAGATWWLENMMPTRFGGEWEGDWQLDKMREFIRHKPHSLT
jgi:alkanesulfonate monooxygenase SsuD/methylene tetrahydromethanopterin reductase-like flavin-dependent oxidoreductase (luciferase family)